ncbi:hypothetical protein NQ315_001106 [Exocentrus adspersus]|uniref:DUF4806 domain-containing protein n=1 Tax=Exocentrus adspersus TaxID=1586481 RepID=A0AAV8WEJ1_9CUCU|nr:hypothetical protein NQ315_001106 [Exocentrus adspersus]
MISYRYFHNDNFHHLLLLDGIPSKTTTKKLSQPQLQYLTVIKSAKQFTAPQPRNSELPAPVLGGPVASTSKENREVTRTETPLEKEYTETILNLLLEVREQNRQILSAVRGQVSSVVDAPPLPVELPVQTEEELGYLCDYISYKENADALAKFLATVGGTSLVNKINNVLKRCLSNNVARNYNFRGMREGKRAFQGLPLKEVVIRAVKLGHPDATDSDIENYIKVWLKHAPSRYKQHLIKQCVE